MNMERVNEIKRLTAANVAHPRADLGGSKRGAVRLFLHTYAGGKCALCGIATRLDAHPSDGDRAEVSHVASVGDSKRGWAPGAVFNGCRDCNLWTADRDLSDMLHLFADVNAIPTMWNKMADLMNTYNARIAPVTTDSESRRIALGIQ